ncbi:MAG: hypothetical protein IKA56_00430 [Clostridia bacterium]|nr:hypothetical protein [Clostridia bacterium]
MEKKEFQKLFKDYMKSKGFKIKGNCGFKYIDGDYAIGVWLDHHPFTKGYFVEYGAVYYPNNKEHPLCTTGDWSSRFYFTSNSGDDLEQYGIGYLNKHFDRAKVVDWFEYDELTEEDFLKQMDINMEKRFASVYDKEFVLNIYRSDWVKFRMIPYDTVRKICSMIGLDAEEVILFRDGYTTKQGGTKFLKD